MVVIISICHKDVIIATSMPNGELANYSYYAY